MPLKLSTGLFKEHFFINFSKVFQQDHMIRLFFIVAKNAWNTQASRRNSIETAWIDVYSSPSCEETNSHQLFGLSSL
jgi:hypothetical protein